MLQIFLKEICAIQKMLRLQCPQQRIPVLLLLF